MVIWRRDDRSCRRCGAEKTSDGRQHPIHHITPEGDVPSDVDPHVPTNLITVCMSCHRTVEGMDEVKQLAEFQVSSREELRLPDDMLTNWNEFLRGIRGGLDPMAERDTQWFVENSLANSTKNLHEFMTDRTTITVSKSTKEQLDDQRDQPWDEFMASLADSEVNSPHLEGRLDEFETRLQGIIDAFDAQDIDAMEREIEAAKEVFEYA